MTSSAQPNPTQPSLVQSSSDQQLIQSMDLWQKALATLDDDLKASLDFKNSTKRDILEKTLKTAEEKKQISLKRRWKIKINNKEVVVRDVLEKIIKWLDHFKAIGDVAVQYDQAHAALPWAGVRFLLKVAVSDTHVFGSTISGLETVSHLITRYAIFEHVYTQRKTVASPGLEPLLTGLYAELLTFLAKAKKYFQKPTAVRALNSVLIAFQTDENLQLQRMASQDAKISAVAILSDAEILNRLQVLEQPIYRIADQAAKYTETLGDTRHREILDWLSPIRYIEHQKRHSERRLQGSGQWLLNGHEYLDWQSSTASSIFLLHGMAGSGKTSLASAVVDSILSQSSNQGPPALLAYLYCSKSATEVELSDPVEIMRSIVRQLGVSCGTQKTIHRAVLNDYERRETEAQLAGFDVTRLSLQDCIRLILIITGADPAIIVLDAIDEVQPKGRYELVEALQQVIRESSSVVKVFATSRDDDQVLSLLINASTLRIGAENQQADVESFVHDQVNIAIKSRRLLGGDVSSKLQADLSRALIDGAGEIFLLVIWQIEKICDMRHEIDVRKAMQRFSQDTLHRLYFEILDSIHKAEAYSRKVALRAFSLLLCLREPLSPASFLAALTFMDGEHGAVLQMAQVLRICFNLIIVDSKLNVLRFAHTSVQEFLEVQTDFVPQKTEGIVAISCLNSCLYNSPVGIQAGLSPTKHYYHYGVLYWAEHCRAVFAAGNDLGLLQLVENFMLDDEGISLSFMGWLEDAQDYAKILPRHHPLKKQLSAISSQDRAPIFTLCVFGLADLLIQNLKATATDCNRKNDSGQTPLYLASSTGHLTVVRILLDRGADLNASGGRLSTPLQAACFQGYVDVVRLLIEKGANMKSRGLFQNALQASVMGNHEQIAMLLLHNGFEINGQSEYDQALQEASQTGFVKVVDHLQKTYGTSFDNIHSAECKGIQAAISKGQIGVLERFMQGFSDPQTELPPCSVAAAASGGHDGMVTLLLDQGLDIEREGQYGSPLRSASLLGQEATVQLLLNRGANVSASSSIGNALEAAATNGHVYIVNSLLQEGVDPNIKGGIYGTALQAAAYRGHLKIAELLLDAGASVYLSGISKDAFHAAAESGHEMIIKLLLAHGYTFDDDFPVQTAQCRRGLPPKFQDLLRASSPDHREENNSSLEPHTWKNLFQKRNYALEEAASNGHLRAMETILDSQTEYRTQVLAEEVGASLYNASRNGHEDIVACLFSRDLDVALYLEKALSAAANNGHLGIINMITAYYRVSLPVGNPTNKVVAMYCARVEEHVLIPGCLGGHVPIITRALDLIGQHYSTADMKRIHKVVLHESSKSNSDKILSLVFSVAQFDCEDIFKAITLSCKNGSNNTLKFLLSMYPHDGPRATSYESGNSANPIRLLGGSPQGERVLLETLDYGLYIAASNGHAQVVKTLIQEDASVNAVFEVICENPWEWGLDEESVRKRISDTPLQANWRAFRCGIALGMSARERAARETIFLLLLQSSTNPSKPDKDLDHLLEFAIEYSSDQLVQSVIDKGVSLMNSDSGRMLALKTAAGRELQAAAVMRVVLQASGYLLDHGPSSKSSDPSDLRPILDIALKHFYERRTPQNYLLDGRFYQSKSIHAVLYTGPGAVVRMLLQLMPREKAKHDGYGLLFQMAVAIEDWDWVNFLFEREANVNAQGYYYGTALQCAARSGNFELVQRLLSAGAEINILKGEHGTALRAAVVGGHEKVVDVLLQHDADVNLRTPDQGDRSHEFEPIIRLALKSPNLTILRSLAAADADLQAELSDQSPTLIIACSLGDLEIVRFFLDNKVDVNPPKRRPSKGYRYPDEAIEYCYCDERASALHLACWKGNEDIARLLLEHGADVQLEVEVIEPEGYSSKTPLQMAAHSGHLHIVQLLINAGVTIDHHNSHGTALSIASSQNRLEVARELLLAGATIFDPLGRWNALAEACRSRDHAVVELLMEELPEVLEERACADALSEAASGGDDDIFQMLLTQNIPTSSSTLSQACAASLLGSVSMLLHRGVDIDGDDGERGRALHVASYGQTEATIDLLLDHGANVNISSPKYGSSLQAALEGLAEYFLGVPPEFSANNHDQTKYRISYRRRYKEPNVKDLAACEHIVRALLARGANPNTTTRSFGNPLHLAAFVGSVKMVQQLLDNGANLHSISDRFDTALFAALERSNKDIVEVLLRAGINVNHFSSKYGTPLHYACDRKDVSMVRLLLDHGAEQDLLVAIKGLAQPYPLREEPTKLPKSEEIVRLFLEHDRTLQATEPTLVAAVEHLGCYGTDTLRLLLQRDGGAGVTEALIEAVKDPDILKVLLNHRPICPITPEVLYEFSKNYRSRNHSYSSYEECILIRLLLDHEQNMRITPTVMSTVLSTDCDRMGSSYYTQKLIEHLFERNNELEVTGSTIKEAKSPEVMKVLLQHAPNMDVTPEMLSAAAPTEECDYTTRLRSQECVLLLLGHDRFTAVPHALANTTPPSAWTRETLDYVNALLDRGPDLPLPSDFLWPLIKVADQHWRTEIYKEHLELFVRHNKRIELSGDMRRALEDVEDIDPELKALLYKIGTQTE
ncbi:MAG: hypothetical protein Q9166_007983 [cf. Caloplaca sp. 2 TL-2023]